MVDEGMTTRHYYGATMNNLIFTLSLTTRHVVHDRTGLTGRYNFTLKQPPSYDIDSLQYNWLSNLGLAIRLEKSPGISLVVDHIERPTPN
jgi:uncharacterized protein (TIGR03435 family)